MARPLMEWTPENIWKRFWASTIVTDQGCWIYTKGPQRAGYPMNQWQGRTVKRQDAHRLSYRIFIGDIPDGLTIDHVCHNEDLDCPGGECIHRKCWRPSHLRCVPRGVNVLAGKTIAARNAAKTHCRWGHEFTPENTWRSPTRNGRWCRKCLAVRQGERKMRAP